MNVYKDFLHFIISFIIIYLPITVTVPNKYLDLVKSGQGDVHPCAIGINLFTILNNTSDEDFYIELLPDECCLETSESLDCKSLNIIGECAEILPKGISEKFQLIAPIINPLERRGYCSFYVDSRPVDRKNKIMRDTVKINFDTTIEKNPQLYDIKSCYNQDEDPLNNCQPVNCETYYNGQKPYYDKVKKRCITTKACAKDQIYDATANDCKSCDSITESDLGFIKSLIQNGSANKGVIIIKTRQGPRKKNFTKTIEVQNKEEDSNDEEADNDEENSAEESETINIGKKTNVKTSEANKTTSVTKKLLMKPSTSCDCTDLKCYCKKVACYIKANKFYLLILGLIIIVQILLLIAMIYYVKAAKCCKQKKVVRKIFNYRQDASVTTPLIGTSNMDTDTTEFNYVTESSHADKKIKCYKACHKELTNQAKLSMSDDILTKYLNRRDWNTTQKEEKPEPKHVKTEPKRNDDVKIAEVTEQNEHSHKHETKRRTKHSEKEKENPEVFKSEREIRSHDYYATTDAAFLTEKHVKPVSKKTASVSTEKGAQACFSNDSVDDLLSEKGILFFEENISKYSFSTSSPVAGSNSPDRSSKTSKNNILKHFLSFLSKNSKLAVSSDPGDNNDKDKLELLHVHMTKGSVHSSDSNVKKIKSNKLFRESRSTF